MAQHDKIIDNQSRTQFRADLNAALLALATHQKGATAPPNPQPGEFWIEDDSPSSAVWTLRMFDGVDWLALAQIDTVANAVQWLGTLGDNSIGLAALPNGLLTANAAGRAKMAAGFITTDLVADAAISPAKLAAAETPTADTFYAGNGSWKTPMGGFSNMQVFTSSGTFTVPAGITKVKVTVVGGGGAGGGAGGLGTGGSISFLGAGGGAGGAAVKVVGGLASGASVSVIVGGGGTGVPFNGGNSGGSSSFGGYCSATGGAGGQAYANTHTFGGNSGAGSGGDINLSGSVAVIHNSSDGQVLMSGAGADAPLGLGFGGRPVRNTANFDGNTGTGFGSGGSGAVVLNIGSRAGGAGRPGVVIVEW